MTAKTLTRGGLGSTGGTLTTAAPGEPLCPFNDGRHRIVATQWGRVCMDCHKTWQWVGKALVATWDLLEGKGE